MACEANCDCEVCCNNKAREIELPNSTIKLATAEFFKDLGKGTALDGSFAARTSLPIIPVITPAVYGEQAIQEVIQEINNVINSPDQTLGGAITQTNRQTIRNTLPALNDRINAGPLTTTEIANFINDSGYPPTPATATQIKQDIKKNPSVFMKLLNAFFALNLTSLALAAICSVLQSPFGVVGSILDTIEDIENALKNLPNAIADFANKIGDAIKDVFENLKEKVNNIVKGFGDTLKGIVDLASNAGQAIAKKFTEMVASVKAFLGDINRDKIIKSVKGMIASAASAIGNLVEGAFDLIDFLLFTFCKISKPLENMINEPVDELKNFADKVTGTADKLDKESAQSTETAVEAGRLAAVPETIKNACDDFKNLQNQGASQRLNGDPDLDPFGGTGPLIFSPQHTSHPEPTEWSNLRFNDSVINNSFWKSNYSVEMRDYYQTKTWDGQYVVKGPRSDCPPDIGYYGIKLEVLEMANQVGEELGLTFTITSGYRHPIYNQNLRNRGKGAALYSQHLKGNALDISYTSAGVNRGNRSKVIRAFRAIGFGGVGIYSTFLHVDIGPVRSW